jgi:hypothetical protein
MPYGDELGDRAARVVGDECHVVQVEVFEELRDECGDARRAEVCAVIESAWV